MSITEKQAQHWAGKDLKIIQSYWDSPPATKRSQWFVEQLRDYQFESVGEIGFFSGRNLRYIQEAFPKTHISGYEINPKAVKFAKEKLGIDSLWQSNLYNLDNTTWTADVVFTSGVLIHVPPESLGSAVRIIKNLSTKYVMHIEHLGKNEVVAGPKHLNPTYKVSDQIQWAPDLLSIYRSFGYEPIIISLPDDCKTNGATELIIVKVKC